MNIEKNSKKDRGSSLLKSFFEIKRPVKSFHSATMPRLKYKSMEEDTDDASETKLFVRNHSYRQSRTSKRYKKNSRELKVSNEKFSLEHENKVKQICQQFEEFSITDNERLVQNNVTEMTSQSVQTLIKEVNAKKKAELALLKEKHENVMVKKRVFEKNSNRIPGDRKIKSFVEAENDEETEEYRKSIITEMDLELAKMKEDGFMDDDENVLDYEPKLEPESSNDIDIDEPKLEAESSNDIDIDDTLLSRMLVNEISEKLKSRTVTDEDQFEEPEYVEVNEINSQELTEEEFDLIRNRFQDEFSDNLTDDLENGLYIVEAYNDDGRELIEVQVMIDRRSLTIGKNNSINEDIKQSDMIFYQNEDKTLNLIEPKFDQHQIVEPIENNIDTNSSANSDVVNLNNLPSTSDNAEEIYEYIEIQNEDNPQNPFFVFAPVSNRSTIYSTTSQDSSVFDEDDEGIDISRNKDQDEIYQNVRRETFCDDKGVVRIERVAYSENLPFINETESTPSVSRSNSITPAKRLEFIMEEIKTTEKKYVEDLAKVVKVYKPYIQSHTSLSLKHYEGYLFGNIEKIYRRQRKFLEAIENSEDIDQIVQCFIDHEHLFELYPNYFKNKPRADEILKEFSTIIREMQEVYEERLDFSAYLLTPVQRLGKYILFLENIEKQLEKLFLPVLKTQQALFIVREEMSKGNDSVAIESIENSPISKMDYGSFMMREKFNIIKPRKFEAMVFLFKNVVVFTNTNPRSLETFYYYDSIKMNDLRIASFDDFSIHLTDFTKSKKKKNTTLFTYILEAKSKKIWTTWKESIEKILWEQLLKAKENSLNTYPLNKKKYKLNRNKIKSTGKHKTVRTRLFFSLKFNVLPIYCFKSPFSEHKLSGECTHIETKENNSILMDEPELRRGSTRKSKNKLRLASFTSYFRSSKTTDELISPPINFVKNELVVDNLSPHVSIQECPFDVTGYGNLIMKEKFKMKKPVKRECVIVFMFERIIVFTTEAEADLFYYLGSIGMNDLSMLPPKKKKRIQLIDFNKNRQTHLDSEYNLKAKDEDVANKWRHAIQKCLWKELLTARGAAHNFLDHYPIPESLKIKEHIDRLLRTNNYFPGYMPRRTLNYSSKLNGKNHWRISLLIYEEF